MFESSSDFVTLFVQLIGAVLQHATEVWPRVIGATFYAPHYDYEQHSGPSHMPNNLLGTNVCTSSINGERLINKVMNTKQTSV